jgi:hypothetical protein
MVFQTRHPHGVPSYEWAYHIGAISSMGHHSTLSIQQCYWKHKSKLWKWFGGIFKESWRVELEIVGKLGHSAAFDAVRGKNLDEGDAAGLWKAGGAGGLAAEKAQLGAAIARSSFRIDMLRYISKLVNKPWTEMVS